jgi:hypothetical protein
MRVTEFEFGCGVVGEVLWEGETESKIYVLRTDFKGNGVFKNGSSQLQHSPR